MLPETLIVVPVPSLSASVAPVYVVLQQERAEARFKSLKRPRRQPGDAKAMQAYCCSTHASCYRRAAVAHGVFDRGQAGSTSTTTGRPAKATAEHCAPNQKLKALEVCVYSTPQ